MNANEFHEIALELALENPLAIRPFLRILEIRYTNEVPTLAVTFDKRPTLLVNLDFLERHCATESQVKAVILHEFLHIILRHTERSTPTTDAEHLATDAVINAIIHRQLGNEYSDMMRIYYRRATGVQQLLRRPDANWSWCTTLSNAANLAWCGLYQGNVVADDIRELAEDLLRAEEEKSGVVGSAKAGVIRRTRMKKGEGGTPSSGRSGIRRALLGNHDDELPPIPDSVRETLDSTLRAMNGSGIWRSPRSRGIGIDTREHVVAASSRAIEEWRRTTLAVLKRHVIPGAGAAKKWSPSDAYLPVLSPRDRRAFVRALWSPFIPEAVWSSEKRTAAGSTNVYLDVSGSMDAEMPHVVSLLNALRRHIRTPFWAFSTEVKPATIREGKLITGSTGGTSMECVLRHIAETRPTSAVVVTDGYIERLERSWLAEISGTRLHAIVTRDGSTGELDRAGLPCTQLGRLPS